MATRIYLGWWVVATASIIPLVLGLLVASIFWARRTSDEIGSIMGAAVVLVGTITFIAREFNLVLATTARCAAEEIPCYFRPEPFVRYSVFAGIGLLQVFIVFLIGLRAEEGMRRKAFAAEAQPRAHHEG
jgi:hypothetical protein